MKIFYLVFSLLISINVYAAEFGVCNFGKQTLPTMICYGPAKLIDTIVSQEVKVAGPLKADHVSMGSLTMAGATELENTTVNGLADISGQLTASDVAFEKDLLIAANNALLHHSTIKGSLQMSANSKKPFLRLECASTVIGSVTFTDTPGIVQLSDDSMVTGKIHNGITEKVDAECE